MSNIFSGKKSVSKDKVEDDYVGGGGKILPSDIYAGKIKAVYMGKSGSSDAISVTFLIDIDGTEHREEIWVSNRNGGVTYTDKKTKEEKNLPGFNQVNSVCMLLCSKEMGDMDVEERMVNIYDFDLKKQIPQAVDCFVELHGLDVQVAVQEQIVDKNKKNESTGNYEAIGSRKNNEILKFFPEDKLVTISEVQAFIESLGGNFDDVLSEGDMGKAIAKMDDEPGVYATKWLDMNKGKPPYDKSSGVKEEGKSFGDTAKKAESTAKKTSLFDE